MKRMYLLCNAHIDPMWQWEWKEGVGATISTFRVAADLCEKYDAFVFNHNEAILYEWIEDFEPELFARIQALVKQGRWHIMGGWYLQPDCNMPSGESFVRQISAGLHYFNEKFGARPNTAINFDPFGHTRGIVQIMEKSGFDSYIICRPYDQVPPTDRFVWKGFAESSVRVLRMPCYNSRLGHSVDRIREEIEKQKNEENGVILWGVGNHGGGPSKIDLEEITKLIHSSKDLEILHAAPEDFFAACKNENWPEHSASLQHTNVGCYSSQIRIKQLHRKLEHELLSAEKMLSAAAMQGLMAYPKKELDIAWKDLMFGQFHDILPGSSIQPVEEAGIQLLHHGLMETERLKTKAFFKLSAGQARAKEGEFPVLVYNPHPYPVQENIFCELMLADQNWGKEFINLSVFDESGTEVPSQVEKEYSNIPLEWRKRVAFRAQLVPSGMTRFNLRAEALPQRPVFEAKCEGECYVFEGLRYAARLNRRTGLLESYVADGTEYIQQPTGKIITIADDEDPWGMRVQGYQKVTGTLAPVSAEETAVICGIEQAELAPVHIIEDGPVRTIIECVVASSQAQAVLRYTFPKNDNYIDLQLRLITTAKNTMFKYSLETSLSSGILYGKTAYGVDELRQNGLECVAQEYVLLSTEENALSIANTGTYALSAENGALLLTLMRTPAYCAHPLEDRVILRQDRFGERMDQGERQFFFRIKASAADERREKINTESIVLNQPPVAVCFFPPENGQKPMPGCLLDNPAVELAAFKPAFDGNGYILRLFNADQKEQAVRVTLPALDVSFAAQIKPLEVLSYRVSGQKAELCEIID